MELGCCHICVAVKEGGREHAGATPAKAQAGGGGGEGNHRSRFLSGSESLAPGHIQLQEGLGIRVWPGTKEEERMDLGGQPSAFAAEPHPPSKRLYGIMSESDEHSEEKQSRGRGWRVMSS